MTDTKQPPLLLSHPEAQALLGGICRTKSWDRIKRRAVKKVNVGRRSFITAKSVAA